MGSLFFNGGFDKFMLFIHGNRISSIGIKENNSNSLSGSTSVKIDSTQTHPAHCKPLCEDADSGIYSYL